MDSNAIFDRPQLARQPLNGPNLMTLARSNDWTCFVPVENHKLYYKIREALTYKMFDVSGDWPTAKILDKRGRMIALLQVRPDPVQSRAALRQPDVLRMVRAEMIALVSRCSHLTADVLDSICATARTQGDVRSPNEYTADAFLEARGLQRHLGGESPKTGRRYRGGFAEAQREKIADQIGLLAHLYLVRAEAQLHQRDEDGKRQRETLMISETPLLLFHEVKTELAEGGKVECQAWRIAPSECFAQVLEGGHIGLLPRQALRYDPVNEHIAKGLARYLPYRWRANHRRGANRESGYVPLGIRVELLLERIHEPVDRDRPGRSIERLERALDRLVDDGLCKPWSYSLTPGDNEQLAVRRRGWVDLWLRTKVQIDPSAAFVAELLAMLPPATYRRRRKKMKKKSPT